MSLRAVIFDVDGILVKSMENHAAAYQKVFAEIGVAIEAREVYANEGRRSPEVIASLAQERGLDLSPAKLDAMNHAKQAAFYAFGPAPLYPGVQALLEKLAAHGLRLAAVTGTNRANVEHHLGALAKLFDVIVTADDVARTKPDPEPYLAALAKLGLRADECIVVENAPLGVKSGRAAGLRVIGVTTTNPADVLRKAGADRIVPTTAEAWSALEGIA
ncbi:MAG: beta-phosphoglucomutase [Thermoplasmata archaeon]|nr:beta-phosphoglucomutase [Thermoplasmata archaeon]